MLNAIWTTIKWITGITLALTVGFIFLVVSLANDNYPSAHQKKTTTTNVSVESSTDQHGYAYQTIDSLAKSLREPDSAEFRNIKVVEGKGPLAGKKIVVGEVNAKNGFGGYTGFEPFIGAPGLVATRSQMSDGEFDKVWNQTIAGAKVLWKSDRFFY